MNVRGTEAFVLVSVIVGLLILSVITTIISLFIVIKLRLAPGSESITFSKDGNIIFNGESDLDRVHLYKNVLKGMFPKHITQLVSSASMTSLCKCVDVQTISGDVLMEAGDSYLSVNANGIEIGSPDGFQVTSTSGKKIFPPDFSSLSLPATLSSLTLPGGARNVHKVRSPVDQDLNIEARERIRVKGNEGVTIDSKEIKFQSNGMFLASINGSIVMDGAQGVAFKLEATDNYPRREDESPVMALQYKLCICGKSGPLFKLHLKNAHNTCADVRFPESINPCV